MRSDLLREPPERLAATAAGVEYAHAAFESEACDRLAQLGLGERVEELGLARVVAPGRILEQPCGELESHGSRLLRAHKEHIELGVARGVIGGELREAPTHEQRPHLRIEFLLGTDARRGLDLGVQQLHSSANP